jgi:CubicO group peptidase (beta-lactamase class C family)
MQLVLHLLILAAAVTGTPAPPPVQVDVKTGPAAEAIHADLARRVPEGFVGAILVEKDGAVVLRAGYGWADRERRTPFTSSTIAQVGSLTKQFTAAAIVDLSLQGKLAFSDPLKRHLEGVPAPAAPNAEITIRPLGMASTGYFFDDALRGRLAAGYTAAGVQPPISERIRPLSPAFWNLKGNGGMQASVEDMYTWYRALARGPVLTEAMRRTLTTPHARRDDGVGYGYGWFVRTRADGEVEQVSHTGSDGVFFSAFVWRPLEKTFYYFVTNTGEKGGAEMASQILRVLTGGPPVEKKP